MEIKVIPVGMYQTNCYLAVSEGHWMVIDPGDGKNAVLRILESQGIVPEYVAVTHGHMDHYADAEGIAERYRIPILYPEQDMAYLDSREARRGPYDQWVVDSFRSGLSRWGRLLREGDEIRLGRNHFQILVLPGHSDGGMCLYEPEEKVLFSGDQLFAQSIGRMDLYRGSGSDLIRAIRQKLLVLPEETVVLPGHGASTSIGMEKKNNPYLSEEALWEI